MIGCGSDSLRSLGSIDNERSKQTDDAGFELSSTASFEAQSIIESGFSELVKDAASGLRFF